MAGEGGYVLEEHFDMHAACCHGFKVRRTTGGRQGGRDGHTHTHSHTHTHTPAHTQREGPRKMESACQVCVCLCV